MSPTLPLKLCLVPALIWAVSLAGRRWGAAVAGWLSALPIVAGPILFTIALERGASFAEVAAANTLLAVVATTVFCLAYARASGRFGIAGSLAAALAAYALAISVLQAVTVPAWAAFAGVLAVLAVAPSAFPRAAAPGRSPSAPRAAAAARPPGDLPLRMLAGALLTMSVTVAAGALGPRLSGMLAMFPVMGTILTGFTHRASGRGAAVALLRGMVLGYFAFASFCVVLAHGLRAWPLGAAFGAATACALAVQLGVKRAGASILAPVPGTAGRAG